MQGDGCAVPLQPPQAFSTKNMAKAEPNKWVNTPQGRQGALAPWHKIILAKQMIVAKIQKSRLVSPQPTLKVKTHLIPT